MNILNTTTNEITFKDILQTYINEVNTHVNEVDSFNIHQRNKPKYKSPLILSDNEIQQLMQYRFNQTQPTFINNTLHTRELTIVSTNDKLNNKEFEIVPKEVIEDGFRFTILNKNVKAKIMDNSINGHLARSTSEMMTSQSMQGTTLSIPVYKYVGEWSTVELPIVKPNGWNVGVITTNDICLLLYTKRDYSQGFSGYY